MTDGTGDSTIFRLGESWRGDAEGAKEGKGFGRPLREEVYPCVAVQVPAHGERIPDEGLGVVRGGGAAELPVGKGRVAARADGSPVQQDHVGAFLTGLDGCHHPCESGSDDDHFASGHVLSVCLKRF